MQRKLQGMLYICVSKAFVLVAVKESTATASCAWSLCMQVGNLCQGMKQKAQDAATRCSTQMQQPDAATSILLLLEPRCCMFIITCLIVNHKYILAIGLVLIHTNDADPVPTLATAATDTWYAWSGSSSATLNWRAVLLTLFWNTSTLSLSVYVWWTVMT